MPFIIEDDVLAPRGYLQIDYKGPNPFVIYGKMKRLLMVIFRTGGKDYFEKDFRWDTSGEPISFFVKMNIERKVDKYTKGACYVVLQGKHPRDPKATNGWVKIVIRCVLTTKYPTETLFQKAVVFPFVYLYHRLMYNDIRRSYLRIHRERVQQLENEVRAVLNLTQKV
jgi:hypothetical protein